MNIGIDLGTTYSAIAVHGQPKIQGNYPEAQYFSECNVTIIPNPLGEFAIPSAFWCDPNDPESFLFGSEAKDMANQGGTPILFSKRSIGTAQVLKIGEQEFTAKQVATEYLKYLKRCAEDALGQTVNRAVITHPAYFSLNQVEETRQAAIDAGFDMSNGEQMLMEPVAAAMAYIASDPRDNITALTYDLGGGTFDVTVLERKDGIITMKAFDGNHLLGGYNFDRRFVAWLLDRVRGRLNDTGRSFVLDENELSDQSSWSRLLQLAEKIKWDLVLKPTAKVPVTIKADNIIADTEGKPIPIIDKISREEYSSLIQDLLDDTIERSRKAIEKAEITPEDIDVIVLVGGSSHGQWVQETVKKAFPGNEVLLYSDPDLCVAAGAAIIAHDLPIRSDSKTGFMIQADIPRISLFQTINVIGSIQNNDGELPDAATRENLNLILETPESGKLGPIGLNDDGVFMFQEVELLDGEPTNLTLNLVDNATGEVVALTVTVEYKPDGDIVAPPTQAVPKSIFLRTGSGLVTIAKEAEKLPVKSREIKLVRTQNGSIVDLDVYQETDWVTTIRVEGIPEDAGEGSYVVLTIEITRQNVMRGMVRVQKLDKSLAIEWPIEITFPPLYIPGIQELEETFTRLDAQRKEAIYNEKDPARRTKIAGLGEKIVKRIRNLFAEQFSDTQEIHQALKELQVLLAPERDEMQPSMEEFKNLAAECREKISESDSDKNQVHFNKLELIEKSGNDAHLTKDKRKWSAAFDQLKSLYSQLSPKTEDGSGPPPELPPTDDLKDIFHDELVGNLQASLSAMVQNMQSTQKYDPIKHEPQVNKIEKAINELQDRIRVIDNQLEPNKALPKLQSIAREKPKIAKMIRRLDVDVEVE